MALSGLGGNKHRWKTRAEKEFEKPCFSPNLICLSKRSARYSVSKCWDSRIGDKNASDVGALRYPVAEVSSTGATLTLDGVGGVKLKTELGCFLSEQDGSCESNSIYAHPHDGIRYFERDCDGSMWILQGSACYLGR
jgi:hypothetical protein